MSIAMHCAAADHIRRLQNQKPAAQPPRYPLLFGYRRLSTICFRVNAVLGYLSLPAAAQQAWPPALLHDSFQTLQALDRKLYITLLINIFVILNQITLVHAKVFQSQLPDEGNEPACIFLDIYSSHANLDTAVLGSSDRIYLGLHVVLTKIEWLIVGYK